MSRTHSKSTGHLRAVACEPYPQFKKINGSHPLKDKVTDSYVDYQVRYRPGGEVMFFNFELAIEIGLITKDHAAQLNTQLSKTLLDTFSLQIINEYDIAHQVSIPDKDIKPNMYMATRYLQLQHPNKQGATSGDGRGIWNGVYKSNAAIWDISSSGTGATALSPATAIAGKYYKTGSRNANYGSGRATVYEGLSAAMNSEIFHYNGIPTERTLLIIKYSDGTAVNVRAAKNLLRPAHLFRYLKQADHRGLSNMVDYYIEHQLASKLWPARLTKKQNYRHLLHTVTHNFAQQAAKLESDYIFCWMAWDGDNIMMDGSIIDFGSIRQFGLFHREYRYDDVDRMSTTIAGQKHQAKYIVQTFAQLVDFLITGKKKPISHYTQHKSLKNFNRIFKFERHKLLLHRIGFDSAQIDQCMPIPCFSNTLARFATVFSYFEHQQSSEGVYEVADGITSNAVFCMRDLLRELPQHLLLGETQIDDAGFIAILKSEYAKKRDLQMHPSRKRKIRLFQSLYQSLIQQAATITQRTVPYTLEKVAQRSALINRFERVTGDGIIAATYKMQLAFKQLGANEMYRIFRNFVEAEILLPEYFANRKATPLPIKKGHSQKILHAMRKAIITKSSGI